MEQEMPKKKRDYLLPGSIVLAAILVVGAIVYSAGKASGNQAANLPGAIPQTGDFTKVQPISASDDHWYTARPSKDCDMARGTPFDGCDAPDTG